MRKAKSRLPHNKLKKRYKNIFGGYFYVGKNDSKNSILVVAGSWITGFLLFILGNSASAKTIDHNPLVSFETIEEQHQGVKNTNTIVLSSPPAQIQTKDEIKQYIEYVFGKDGDMMVKIATCESGLNPHNVGDQHIMGELDGEMVGDSIGLFQVRTGDAGVYDKTPWNRAKANDMTADQFREYLKDSKNNIDYAKQIFDRQGVEAWHNCYQKVK